MSFTESKIGRFMIGVGCIMEHQPTGKILCMLRDRANFHKGEWELMYGRIDQHEDIFEALQREVKEETGKEDFEVKRLLRIWHFYRGEKKPETEIHGFTFHCVTQTQTVNLSTEHSEYAWLDPADALQKIEVPGIQEDVRFFMEHRDTQQIAFSGISNTIQLVL